VEKSGFKRHIRADVTLHVLDALGIDFEMPLGAAVETVVVQAGAPLLNISDASASTLVDQTFVMDAASRRSSCSRRAWS
jgi:hypothetical protein